MDWWQSLLIIVGVAISTNCISEALAAEHEPVVMTDSGPIRGFTMNSRSGRRYYAFTKIPYAKPPLGPLRFKEADPDVQWDPNVILETNEDLPDCLQIPIFDPNTSNLTMGTEDCLYLSVFTPKLGSDSNDLPVMVWIHGGGWRSELPARGTQAPKSKFLMDEDVVLITFHYRLGALGFLTTEDEVLPGNLGLKDQNLVLQWVKRNIAKFGGDSNKITVFGNSAGGVSSHYHLISPLSKDLVQGGISQSGIATCLWGLTVPGTGAEKAWKLAKHLGCPEKPTEQLVACLRTKSAWDITDAERLFMKRDFDPLIVFQPVIESGPGAFLTDSPYNLKVEKPWIVGFTSEDGAFKTLHYKVKPELMESFLAEGVDILPDALMFANTTEDRKQVATAILEHYTDKDGQIDMTNMWTDGLITYGADQAIRMSDGNAYQYVFAYRGKTSANDILVKKMNNDIGDLGVGHTDEILYLFNYQEGDETKLPEADEDVSKRLVKKWTDFARYGYPKTAEDWKPYKNEKNYLKITKEDKVEKDVWPSRVSFWRNLPIRNKMEQMNL